MEEVKLLERAEAIPTPLQQDHDLVQELNRHLDALCDYSERIAKAEGEPEQQRVWRELQRQEQSCVRELKQLITGRMEKGEFLNDL